MKSILNRDFEYTPASHTNTEHLQAVFQRERERLAAEAAPN